jgi:hypothetical protein
MSGSSEAAATGDDTAALVKIVLRWCVVNSLLKQSRATL